MKHWNGDGVGGVGGSDGAVIVIVVEEVEVEVIDFVHKSRATFVDEIGNFNSL